ncbi:MAG: rhodanese-like domain-containing protein [Trueperaceae bacterium]
MSTIPEIDIHEAKTRIDNGALLVDVREQNEFDDVRIPGSVLVPLSEFQTRYEELPKEKEIVMQCRSGARSGQATEFLLTNGYSNVVNMAGGILAWHGAGLPTESGKKE